MSEKETADLESITKELNETKQHLIKAEEEIVKLKAQLIEKSECYKRTLLISAALVLRSNTITLDDEQLIIPI